MQDMDTLKNDINDFINTLSGNVKHTDINRWVRAAAEQPTESGYYIVLGANSNPNFIHTCRPGLHFWDNNDKSWSSHTEYWLQSVDIRDLKIDMIINK